MENTNVEIEQYLISNLIHNPDSLFEIKLKASDLYAIEHQAIYQKMESCIAEKGAFDFFELQQWAKNKLPDNYLSQLRDICISPTISTTKQYAEILTNLSKKRTIKQHLNTAIEQLQDSEIDPQSILDKLTNIFDCQDHSPIKTGQEVFNQILDGFKTPNQCYPTGLNQLDNAMAGGMYSGWTYGFGGAEKAGKTMLAGTIANNMTANGTKILYIALEMGSQQIEQRQIASRLGFNPIKFLQDKKQIAGKVAESKPNQNIYYMDSPGATLEEILLTVTKAKAKFGIDGFIVDYWQLIENNEKFPTEEQKLRHNAQSLANFARKKGLFCMLMAQVNKTGDLFGGNGLVKACDQLYLIKSIEDESDERYLEMRVTRYTLKADIGSETNPYLKITKTANFQELF